MKKWQSFNDECIHCGNIAEVLTSSGKDNWAFDGDEAKCAECGCPGQVVVIGHGEAYVAWHEEHNEQSVEA